MLNHTRLNRKRSAGFGLIEVMVALAIGMFGVMVMMQVLSVSEEQRRTTTGGNDAMNEGVMALYALQTDIRMAGYDIADTRLLGCNLTLPSGVTLNGMVTPVTINYGPINTLKDTNTDTLVVFYGSSNGTPNGIPINAGNQVVAASSVAAGDWVFQVTPTRPNTCTLTLEQVKNVTTPAPPALGVVTLQSNAALVQNNTLFNLGQSFKAVGYAVRNGSLTTCNFTVNDCTAAASWTAIANNIVSMRAQYGKDTTTPMDGIVDIYEQAATNSGNLACDMAKISALRMAVVARSAQYEKPDASGVPVTTAAPVWYGTTAGNPTGSAINAIDLSSTLSGSIPGITAGTEWQYYRYKVFQTVVPLRNISWMGKATGC